MDIDTGIVREKRIRLPATTVAVSVEPAQNGAATVVIRYRVEAPGRDRPRLRVLDGGRSAVGHEEPAACPA